MSKVLSLEEHRAAKQRKTLVSIATEDEDVNDALSPLAGKTLSEEEFEGLNVIAKYIYDHYRDDLPEDHVLFTYAAQRGWQ